MKRKSDPRKNEVDSNSKPKILLPKNRRTEEAFGCKSTIDGERLREAGKTEREREK